MKIAVLGAGAMGSWFGGQLALAGNHVCLLTTNDAHIQAIQQSGHQMHSEHGIQSVQLAIEKPERFRQAVDLVILLTKSFKSKPALSSIAKSLMSDTIVLSLQNGLGNDTIISEAVGAENTWLGVTMVPVDRLAPGVVECKGTGDTWFGPLQNEQHKKTQATAGIATVLLTSSVANAAEFDFKLHHLLSAKAPAHTAMLEPWAQAVAENSGGRVNI